MDQATIRRRLHALREQSNISQTALSQVLGFNDRQTLSDIELGKRNVAPAELIRAAEFFGVDTGYFTDPFELAGEARFSWRKTTGGADDLETFENRAGRWIATYRHLSRLKGESVNSSLTQIDLSSRSSFEEASAEGDAVSRTLDLGEIPAIKLASVLEEKLDTLILNVDTVAGVSGAACQLGPLNTIIINRREAEGRRSFDMGHELFHLITWQQMPPRHIEGNGAPPARYKRIEQLADNFSSALLMPHRAVACWVERFPFPEDETELAGWLKQGASHFLVSGQAFKWRLVSLGLLRRTVAECISEAALRMDCPDDARLPARYSRRFMETLGWAIEEGHISVRRAASIIGTTVDELADIFSEHGLKTPFDL